MMNNEYNLAKKKKKISKKRDHDEYYYSRKSICLLVSILFINMMDAKVPIIHKVL
jgi:hypothetical protein